MNIEENLKRLGETLKAKRSETIINDAFQKNNNYVKLPVKGILNKKQHERDTTKFKLVVWYNTHKNGVPFSVIEKNNGLNRKYHDSIDFVPHQCDITKQIEYVTRHDLAFEKLFNHLTYYSSKIDKAIMFVNDWANNQQLHIIHWHNDISRCKFVHPEFEVRGSHVFFKGLLCPAIKIDELK